MKNMWRQFRNRDIYKDRPGNVFTQWERDYTLNECPKRCLDPEYLEMGVIVSKENSK